MDPTLLGEVVVTLIVIMDPPGNVPTFLSVIRRLIQAERDRAALIAVATAFTVIAVFALVGRQILDDLHVPVPTLKAPG